MDIDEKSYAVEEESNGVWVSVGEFDSHEEAGQLYRSLGRSVSAPVRIVEIRKKTISEFTEVDTAESVFKRFRSFCNESEECKDCKYYGEKTSVHCLKRFLKEWSEGAE